jgi:hypothetical protein
MENQAEGGDGELERFTCSVGSSHFGFVKRGLECSNWSRIEAEVFGDVAMEKEKSRKLGGVRF